MDESTRLRMRTAHAKHAWFCTCGKVVRGNGGRANHVWMHERREDGHYGITQTAYYERLGNVLAALTLAQKDTLTPKDSA